MRDVNITAENVMEDMQESINRWEGGLKAIGLSTSSLLRSEIGHTRNRKKLTLNSQLKTTMMRYNH